MKPNRARLFVQLEDGSIKQCFKGMASEVYLRDVSAWIANYYDRWWIVECECADDGRETIRAATLFAACAPGSLPDHFVGPGRIIASGGNP
jgi:hypothetical protein